MQRQESKSSIKIINIVLTLIYFLLVYISFKVQQNLIYEYSESIAKEVNLQVVIYIGLIANVTINITIMYNILKLIFRLSKSKYKKLEIYLFMVCNLCTTSVLPIIFNNYINSISGIALIEVSNIIIPIMILLFLENVLKEKVQNKTYVYIGILYIITAIISTISKVGIL